MKKILFLVFLFFAASTFAQPVHKMKMAALLKRIDTTTTPLVVNFWATWCAPCVHEIPWFEKTVQQFAPQKVKLLLVSIDFPGEYPKGIAAFAKQKGYTSEIVWLDETDIDSTGRQIDKLWEGTIPVTLMINNSKRYRRFYNQQLPEPRLVQELKLLVD